MIFYYVIPYCKQGETLINNYIIIIIIIIGGSKSIVCMYKFNE